MNLFLMTSNLNLSLHLGEKNPETEFFQNKLGFFGSRFSVSNMQVRES